MENTKQAVLIVASNGFQDKEFEDTQKVLQEKDINTIVSSTENIAKGKLGKVLEVDVLLKDLDVSNYSAIVFIGGPGATDYKNNETALQIAQKARQENKILGAICIAPVILAKASILQGKNATVWSNETNKEAIDFLKENGANFIDKPIVIDGNIITGNGPGAAYQFGLSLADNILNN